MHKHGKAHITPRWVKTIGISISLLLVFAGLHLFGMRFLEHGEHSGHTPPAVTAERGQKQP